MTKPRGPWQGMLSIFRFNRPLYLAAGLVLLGSLAGALILKQPAPRFLCAAATIGSAYFIVMSLGVSHLVYDRSDLYRWRWLQQALAGMEPERVIVCHAGFDEVSEALKDRLAPTELRVLDHFDPLRMTEPSIHCARRLFPPTAGTVAAPFDRWPLTGQTADVVLGLLAIHEFRSEEERSRWFAEARRHLKPGGRIIIAEHLRDLANFIAFGPGFLHFHSAASWRRSWESAGLFASGEHRITPWVRVFVITAP